MAPDAHLHGVTGHRVGGIIREDFQSTYGLLLREGRPYVIQWIGREGEDIPFDELLARFRFRDD